MASDSPGRGDVLDKHEGMVLDAGSVVIRNPQPARVHIDEAARATVPLLEAESGVVEVLDSKR